MNTLKLDVLASASGHMAVLWEIQENNGGTVTVGPYATAEDASAGASRATGARQGNGNVVSTSGVVDVSGREKHTTVYTLSGGDYVGHPPAVYRRRDGWHARVVIPQGRIFVQYWSGSSNTPNGPQ